MAVTPITATEAAQRIGKAWLYTGDPMTPGGLVSLGGSEGEISVDEGFEYNDLTAPEWTGPAVHASWVQGQKLVATVPLVMKSDGSQLVKITPTGQRGGGWNKQRAVITTGVLIAPEDEVGTGLSWNGSAWVPAAPKLCIWIWKARIQPGPLMFKHTEGGKSIREINIEALYDDTKPDGYKLYYVGDPRSVGINVNP